MLNLNEGLTLMATGMGTVFSFLIILWFAVSIMGKVVAWLNKLFPEQVKEAITASPRAINPEIEIAIAIAAAKLRK